MLFFSILISSFQWSNIGKFLFFAIIFLPGSALHAQNTTTSTEKSNAATDMKDSAAVSTGKLTAEQKRIAEKYKHIEDVILRMAELSAPTDPRRAALLKRRSSRAKKT